MASKLRVPVGSQMLETDEGKNAHHIQACLKQLGRPFADFREFREFVGLTDNSQRAAFIESRVVAPTGQTPIAASA